MKTFFNSSMLFYHDLICNKSGIKRKQISLPFLLAFLLFVAMLPKQIIAQSGVQGLSKLTIQLVFTTAQGNNITADGCVIAYKDNFLTGLGPEDSYKFTNLDENMAIPFGSTMLSVIGKPMLSAYDTIPLRIWQYRQSNYILKIDGTNFPPNMEGVLKDNYLNQESPINLAGNTLVNFSITADSASYAVNRFCVFLRPVAVLSSGLISLSANQKDAGVTLHWSMANVTTGTRFEVMKSITPVNFVSIANVDAYMGNNNYEYIDRQTEEVQYYKLKIVSPGGGVQYSRVIKISKNSSNQSINIYPNPVKGSTIGLQLYNFNKGKYQLKIYNTNGQEVYVTLIDIPQGNTTLPINVNKKLERGTYHLRVINSNQNFTKKLIID